MKKLILLSSLLALLSCSEDQKKETQKVTEDFTGVTAVKTGQEMKSRIDSISAVQEKRAEEMEKLLK